MKSAFEHHYAENLPKIDFDTAYSIYQEILPFYRNSPYLKQKTSKKLSALEEIIDLHDIFICDGYGVLNYGPDPVPGMPEFISKLQTAGKRVFVMTNGSTFDSRHLQKKYTDLGYSFDSEEIFSSRDALIALSDKVLKPGMKIGVASTRGSEIDLLPLDCMRLGEDPKTYEEADAFLLLSSGEWDFAHHRRLSSSLKERPREVLVSNPDVTAPFDSWFSAEPGYYASLIQKETGILPHYFGKPFLSSYEKMLEFVFRQIQVPKERILMIGDTPYTDILGGNQAGIQTLLLTSHGFLKNRDIDSVLKACGIFPDYIF